MITIVSGLPRSGTSMMMQMLRAGGMPLLADEQRKADDDNPLGYFEFERVKKLKTDASWLDQAEGKAVKVITQLLPDLPPGRDYYTIFMLRDLDEVLRSQREMLVRRGQSGAALSDDKMKDIFSKHLERTQSWLSAQPNFKVLSVRYAEVIRQPLDQARNVAAFLGGSLDADKMAAAVNAQLYRNVHNKG